MDVPDIFNCGGKGGKPGPCPVGGKAFKDMDHAEQEDHLHAHLVGAGKPIPFSELRKALGAKTHDPHNPLRNPVHATAVRLRDKGRIKAVPSPSGFGEASITHNNRLPDLFGVTRAG